MGARLGLRVESWLRVLENRVLRGTFGSRTDEVTREWRRLHIDELNDLYCSPHHHHHLANLQSSHERKSNMED